jgi:hypothetical protein
LIDHSEGDKHISMERAKLSHNAVKATVKASATGRNGGRRPGAGRPKGSRNKLKSLRLADGHVSILARRWTPRILHDAAMLAFGSIDPNEPANPKLRTQDEWLRLAIWKVILDRAWGRAPMEVRVEATKNVNVKYTREEIARLSLEQISALWREQIAAPAGITYQPGPPDA